MHDNNLDLNKMMNDNFDDMMNMLRNQELSRIVTSQFEATMTAVKLAYIQEDDPDKKAELKLLLDDYESRFKKQNRENHIFMLIGFMCIIVLVIFVLIDFVPLFQF